MVASLNRLAAELNRYAAIIDDMSILIIQSSSAI
jgi:hypothetical protein